MPRGALVENLEARGLVGIYSLQPFLDEFLGGGPFYRAEAPKMETLLKESDNDKDVEIVDSPSLHNTNQLLHVSFPV